ncbi:MAG: aminodeoxychorismate/anthranilate synthase component II [Spirochaetes bacterium]|nr:aminodeoxychorismate/anthranilate synthase component II [Spirochaetota bacterium]
MFLMIDNFDSFTYNIVNYVGICGEKVDVILNNEDFSKIDFSKYKGIFLSPGPSSPENAGITLDVIKADIDIPIFGICLGMQSIAYCYDGEVIHAKQTMHGKVDTITHFGCDIFKDLPESFRVVRYHSLAVNENKFPANFKITAKSSDGEIMGMHHVSKPVYGVQFHPESYLTEYGIEMIKNFLGVCYEYRIGK